MDAGQDFRTPSDPDVVTNNDVTLRSGGTVVECTGKVEEKPEGKSGDPFCTMIPSDENLYVIARSNK